MSAPIKGILFDMDNTLIDWTGFEGDWLNIEMEHMGQMFTYLAERDRKPTCDVETFTYTYRDRVMAAWKAGRTSLRAPRLVVLMTETLADFGVTLDDELTIQQVMIEGYGFTSKPGVTVFPDVPDALQALMDRGVRIGLVTNAFQPMWLRDVELREFDLLRFFPQQEHRITAADVGYLKPHPQIFEHAVDKLGTSITETIYVGDNPSADIDGAQGAGMRAVLRRIENKVSPMVGELVFPDAIIDGLDELLAFVDDPAKMNGKSA